MKKLLLIFSLIFLLLPQAKADTTPEEKIYILSSVWRNVRDNFAFPQHFEQSNPDSLYKAFLPRVMSANSELEFASIMTEFLAKFDDAHTRFYAETPTATVPIKFIGLDGMVYVKNIEKRFAKQVPIGSQLISINGQNISDYLGTSVYPYVAASNRAWKFRKSLDSFLNGEQGTEVTLEFLTPKQMKLLLLVGLNLNQ